MKLFILAEEVTPVESLLIALVCILIVFAMLALLWGIVALFRLLPKKQQKTEESRPVVISDNKKTLKLEDITDDDMMVAALVATIEYHNETGKDVKVTSIKEL